MTPEGERADFLSRASLLQINKQTNNQTKRYINILNSYCSKFVSEDVNSVAASEERPQSDVGICSLLLLTRLFDNGAEI